MIGPVLLGHIVDELKARLTGGVVSKIHQPGDRLLIIRVFVRGREERLLISTHPRFSRMHLTESVFENPRTPPRFAAFLRSRIGGARIEDIFQIDRERIVHIRLARKEGEELKPYTLVLELTGKSSNIILLDGSGIVLDALRRFPVEGSVRPVVPGLRLEPLPKGPRMERPEEPVEKRNGETWNSATDRFYFALERDEMLASKKRELRAVIKGALKKAERKLKNLMDDRERANKNLELEKTGSLLSANFNLLKRGMSSVELEDIYCTPPKKVTIELDPQVGPKENIERFFKKARKAKKALELLKERIPEVEEEIIYIDGLMFELDSAETTEDLRVLEAELMEAGYLKKKPVQKTLLKGGKRAGPVKKAATSDGFTLIYGRSGAGNDLIIKKYSSPGDLWFHAKGVPGSHVLLKADKRKPTERAVEEAAALAAFLSRNRTSAKAEVIYTEAGNVKKPKGAKPGMVVVKEFKTIMVRPSDIVSPDNG